MNTAKIKLRARPDFEWNCESQGFKDGVVWPQNPDNLAEQKEIENMLIERKKENKRDYHAIDAPHLSFTGFYVVHELGFDALDYFNSKAWLEIFLAYLPESRILSPHIPKEVDLLPRSTNGELANTESIEESDGNNATVARGRVGSRNAEDDIAATRSSEQPRMTNKIARTLSKKALDTDFSSTWYLSMVSWARGAIFDPSNDPNRRSWLSNWDNSYGQSQTIYVVEVGLDEDYHVSHPPLIWHLSAWHLCSLSTL
jgi:hypothetical protein